MVQLHVSEDAIKSLLSSARQSLGDKAVIIERLYYDLLSDPNVTSLSTIHVHLEKARRILKWMLDNGVEPEKIDRDVLTRYIIYLKTEKKVTQSTLKTYMRVLRRLLKVLGKEELTKYIKYPKEKIKPPRLPTSQLIERIIGEIRDPRYRLAIALMYETGARVSEILSLKRKHIEEAPQGYYRILIEEPKNGEFRIVYVIKYASMLRDYLISMGINDSEQLLFPSPSRPGEPLHPRNIEKILRRYGRIYGVRLYPHILRHLRGTLLIKEGVSERIVMKILGHRDPEMVQVYVNLVHQDVEEVILRKYGINPIRENTDTTITCPRCGATNPKEANYCWRCGYPLHQQAALELEIKEKEVEEKLRKLLEIIKIYPEIIKDI